MSTPLFNYMILIGITVALMGIPILGLQMLDVSKGVRDSCCQMLPHFITHPAMLIISLLIARNWRLHRLFNNKKLQKLSIMNRNLLQLAAIPMSANMLLLTVWSIKYPVESVMEFHAPVHWTCKYKQDGGKILYLDLGLFVATAIVGIYIVSLVRKVNSSSFH
jgi:hypothetical protein